MRAKLAGVGPFVAVLALATWAPAQEGTPTTITDIRQESTDRSTRLVVECTGPLAYTYYSPDPSRWWSTFPKSMPPRSPHGSTWARGKSSPSA